MKYCLFRNIYPCKLLVECATIHSIVFGLGVLIVFFSAIGQVHADAIQISTSGTANDIGTPLTITGSTTFDTTSGIGSGQIAFTPQAVCVPWVVKAVIWVYKDAKPAGGISLLDIAGGDLGGTLRMEDSGTGTNIIASFRLTQLTPTTANAIFQIDAQYDPTITLTGMWSSSETITTAGVGQAIAMGRSVFHRTDGTEIVAPYNVSYQFLGNSGAQLLNPIQASQDVNFDLSTGNFTSKTTAQVVPEPTTIILLGTGLAGVAINTWKRFKRRQELASKTLTVRSEKP